MGTPCCCLNLFNSLQPSDYIDLLGIVVNGGLAYWIIKTIQDKLTNKRVLKDHFIDEVKELRNEYKNCLSNLYLNKTHAKNVAPWFKLMNIKVTDIMLLIYDKYEIDINHLDPYQNKLRDLVTDNPEFISQYNLGQPVVFTDNSRNQFIKFQQEHNRLFNDLIIMINDSN
ncbi:MAG: hypothetical protein ABI723_10495 [Bacteroidia bacterium]